MFAKHFYFWRHLLGDGEGWLDGVVVQPDLQLTQHSPKWISVYFQIIWIMIGVTVLLSILNQMYFHLVQRTSVTTIIFQSIRKETEIYYTNPIIRQFQLQLFDATFMIANLWNDHRRCKHIYICMQIKLEFSNCNSTGWGRSSPIHCSNT